MWYCTKSEIGAVFHKKGMRLGKALLCNTKIIAKLVLDIEL